MVFVMETHCVLFEVGAESLNIVQASFGFKSFFDKQH
jgi:hypothetical protein